MGYILKVRNDQCQSRTDERHKSKSKEISLIESMERCSVGKLLYEKWCPELISKRIAIESLACVSHETIYQWDWGLKKQETIQLQFLLPNSFLFLGLPIHNFFDTVNVD